MNAIHLIVAWLLERKGLVGSAMTNSELPENLFAHELVQILAEHGTNLAQLADLVDVDPDTIQRLQVSLTDPRFSPVLGLDELEQLEVTLPLDETEQGRLQAALVAIAIKRLLRNQLGHVYARQITERIYPDLLNAFLNVDIETLPEIGRRGDGDSIEDDEIDRIWASILEAMDTANTIAQLSGGLSSTREQMKRLQDARSYLEEALAELESLPAVIKKKPFWRNRYQKVKNDLNTIGKQQKALEKK